ncbi:MAG: glutathione peroxidase [Pseudomonadota bacterium]
MNAYASLTINACPALLQHTFKQLEDAQPISLATFYGKAILVVNTASECLFTPQYQGLEDLYQCYKSRGLIILGFPSNDFGAQEPGGEASIAEFCIHNYKVSFPMFTKTHVKGEGAHSFYKMLKQKTGAAPRWNFHKYLIYPKVNKVKSFSALTFPSSGRLKRAIECALESIEVE